MAQQTYAFSVVLRQAELSEAECDTLYAAGCDDGTIVTREGRSFIAFDRESESLESAIRTAATDVRAAGLQIDHVEMDVLV
jgi:hypothetical protein